MKPPLERVIQRGIITQLRLKGFTVWSTSQGYRRDRGGTRMSPGIPDLYALHPTYGAIWVEVKRPGGKIREAQVDFCRAHHELWGEVIVPDVLIWYSLEQCQEWLKENLG